MIAVKGAFPVAGRSASKRCMEKILRFPFGSIQEPLSMTFDRLFLAGDYIGQVRVDVRCRLLFGRRHFGLDTT